MDHASQQRRLLRFLSAEEFEARLCLAGVAFAEHDIVVTEAAGAQFVYAADVDGDGDVDILSAAWNSGNGTKGNVAWYENTDGRGTFGPQQVIGTGGSSTVHAADLDGDGDMDVLSAAAWYENIDGQGTFEQKQTIGGMFAADVDGDGDVDVLSASRHDDKIAWYENTDGAGTFESQQVITTDANRVLSLHAADVDGDGDVDVLSASLSRRGQIAWYENTDGNGTFGPQQTINTEPGFVQSVRAADVDGDGDVDVLSSTYFHRRHPISWHENTDGKGSFGEAQIITTEELRGRESRDSSVHAADLDGDGDVDVLSASMDDDRIAWYENTDGNGRFFQQHVIAKGGPRSLPAWSVYAADVDGDGDVDVLSAGKLAWYENLSPQLAAGDANRDLQFDQQDIVQVLQAAKYLTGEAAAFEDGDWTGDGVFDQLDIVAALQTGNYLQGPYAAQAIDSVFGGK